MTRDIKKLAKEIRKEEASLPLHHEANFERLLLAELHLKKDEKNFCKMDFNSGFCSNFNKCL